MKLVKEHIILEKFVEDSDPIHDLGIGGTPINIMQLRDQYRKKYKNDWEKGKNMWYKRIESLLKNHKLYGIFDEKNSKPTLIECHAIDSSKFGENVSVRYNRFNYKILEGETYLIKNI